MGAQVAFEIELFAKYLIWNEIQKTTFFVRNGAKSSQGDYFLLSIFRSIPQHLRRTHLDI